MNRKSPTEVLAAAIPGVVPKLWDMGMVLLWRSDYGEMRAALNLHEDYRRVLTAVLAGLDASGPIPLEPLLRGNHRPTRCIPSRGGKRPKPPESAENTHGAKARRVTANPTSKAAPRSARSK